ncbi:MAG: ABC transporter permease [Spirochaetales bacterium]|uniref:ABC transporter permease n=1 Tax=Candidatus Thalassospirochaeta sargassi TaxID=3119039 RepID=A0AAJ1IG11_9SPIO|nr:ABC transporter permease [Spirochaetales bacterium]
MLKKWVLFISSRYIRADRRNRKVSPGILSAAGIAVGVLALISVISVMNGFQMGFIEDIVEISSYHLRLSDVEELNIEEIRHIDGISSICPFYETKTLVSSPYRIEPAIVKGVPVNARELDPAFFRQLNIFRGDYEPDIPKTVVIGRLLALRLGLNIGDSISIVALNGGSFTKLRPQTDDFIITGLFQSGYDDFDLSMMIMSVDDILSIDSGTELKYGVKLDNRFRDRQAAAEIVGLENLAEENITSWREYNKAFFSALRLEKSMMFILLGLIFLVVSFGIFNSTRRTIAEKQEEIGILRAIGSTPAQIRQIFVMDGLMIGLGGGIAGVFCGLAVTLNINEILSIMSLRSSFLINMPVRIVPVEILSIFVFAVGFCVFSAFVASRKVSQITPQEVLRYE